MNEDVQMVTQRGVEKWQCLQAAARLSLKERLLSNTARTKNLVVASRCSVDHT